MRVDPVTRCYAALVLSAEQLARIVPVLDGMAGLDALWIFGSAAEGRDRSSSDLDLAALFRAQPGADAVVRAREALADIVGRPVDLVDLDRASPILGMQVLRHGNLAFERDAAHRVRFTASLPGRYEDVMILRRPLERLLKARLNDRT